MGEIRPALELARFQNKVEKERPKQVSPRQRLGNCSQATFAQNGQKNYYSVHSLCHSAVVGCHSFAPFGGVSLLHPIPRALPGAGISMPLRGVNLPPIYIPRALPGADMSMPFRGVGSLTFRRICYPPELNIRIFNLQYPATQPPRKRGVEAHPDPPKERGGKATVRS